jgi:hypothetical protein
MLRRRFTVDGASFVCSVERTRCPVSAAFDADLGRLEVADLADHDDVGVLAQEGAQGGGEVEPDLVVHLHLVDADQVELDRVLGGRDVRARPCSARRAPSRASSSSRCPVGPVTSTIPNGLLIASLKS